jgi:4-amino-4-deoxy-L-arabinose transferase-like glycosyltransferase
MSLKQLFHDKFNLIFIGVFIFALIVRLWYFKVNQALWFDEAEYLSMAKSWAFDIYYKYPRVRPPLFSLGAALLYKIGATEIWFRIVELLFSMAGILMTYLLGKELYDKKVGLIASAILSFFFIHIFYSARILVDIPTATIYLLSAYLFWKGYVLEKSRYYIWAFGAVTSLGVLTRFPLGLIAIIALIYMLITEGFAFLKNKDWWISGTIFLAILSPYLVWFYNEFRQIPILSISYGHQNFLPFYLGILPSLFRSPIPVLTELTIWSQFFILFLVIGLGCILFNLLIGYDMIKKDKALHAHLFVFLLTIVPFLYFSLFLGLAEDRYLMYMFSPSFFIIALSMLMLHAVIARYNKIFATVVIVLLLFLGAYSQVSYADILIKSKADSYIQFRDAGEWMKSLTDKGDAIINNGVPQNTYYSERATYSIWEQTEGEFHKHLKEIMPKFIVISLLEKAPDWAYQWPMKHSDVVKPVKAYFMDAEQKQPIMIIYAVNTDALAGLPE